MSIENITITEPSWCTVTNYTIQNLTYDDGKGNQLAINESGILMATIDTEYVYSFEIEICTRNAESGDENDCKISNLTNI